MSRNAFVPVLSTLLVAMLVAAPAAYATDYYWTGGAGDGLWSSAGNWATDDQGTPADVAPQWSDKANYYFTVPNGGLTVTQDITNAPASASGILASNLVVATTAFSPVEMKIVSPVQNANLEFTSGASITVAADVTLVLNTDMGGTSTTADLNKYGEGVLAFDLIRSPLVARGLVVNEGRVVVLPTSKDTRHHIKMGGTNPANSPVYENQLENGVYGYVNAQGFGSLQLNGKTMVVGDVSDNVTATNVIPAVSDGGTMSFGNERVFILAEKEPSYDIELNRADVLYSPKIVVSMSFDDTANPKRDDVGFGARLIPFGTTSIVEDSERGNVLSLDGASGFQGPDEDAGFAEFGPAQGFTLSMWLKPAEDCDDDARIFFFGEGVSAHAVALRLSDNAETNLIFSVWNTHVYLPVTDIRDGNWHHVTVTYNGKTSPATFNIYYDGAFAGSTPLWVAYAPPNMNFYLGRVSATSGWTGGANPYTGLIDDFFLSNRALAGSEVYDIYANGISAFGGSPVFGAVSAESAGVLSVDESAVSVKTLSGNAFKGGIDMTKAGATLTVGANAGTAATVFHGIVSGRDATLVKEGADYTLTLAGSTKGITNVVVNEGTLTLRHPKGSREGLVCWYSFNDATDFGHDEGPAGFHLVKSDTGTPTAVPGISGSAVHFSGTSSPAYFDSANQSPPSSFPLGNQSFTVSLWIRPTPATCNNSTPVFCWGNKNGNGTLMLIRFDGSGQKLAWAFNGDAYMLKVSSAIALDDGDWHHLVATYNGETRQKTLYCDGSQIGLQSLGSVAQIQFNKMEIAHYNLSDTYKNKRFEGDMDEFMVFDYAWSMDEVLAEYNHTAASVSVSAADTLPEPVARWTFDGADPLADTTGNAALHLSQFSVGGDPNVTFESGEDICGKAARFTASSGFLRLETFPTGILPVGNVGLTAIVRYRPDTVQHSSLVPAIMGWGGASGSGQLFRFQTDPGRGPSVRAVFRGFAKTVDGTCRSSFGNERTRWYTAALAYLPSGSGRMLVDGVYAATGSSQYQITAERFAIGSSYIGDRNYYGLVDDIQIYDTTLSDEQIRMITERLELSKGSAVSDAPIPKGVLQENPDVTVAQGATLKVSSVESIGNLSGMGSVEIEPMAQLNVSSINGFSGSVSGSGYIGFGDDAVIDFGDATAPLVLFDHPFALGKNVTINTTATQARHLIARASSFIGTDNLRTWTATVGNREYYFLLSSDGKELYLSIQSGSLLIFR